MKNLIKKYPSLKDDIIIKEKDIIYFSRDALSSYNKDGKKEVYEQEILELIKNKDWDWFYKDIDKNIILTYPIYNNAFTIVEYLIENKKYNVEEYNEDISNALCSSITLVGETMMNYLLSQDNLHIDYKNDMAIKAYMLSSVEKMADENREIYMNKALEIVKKGTSFYKIVDSFIFNDQKSSKQSFAFRHFLETFPLEPYFKIEMLNDLLNKERFKPYQIREYYINEKIETVEEWKLYYILQDELKVGRNSNLRMKI